MVCETNILEVGLNQSMTEYSKMHCFFNLEAIVRLLQKIALVWHALCKKHMDDGSCCAPLVTSNGN